MTVVASPSFWPLWIGAALLLFAGVYHQVTDRVPNWISFGTLFAALFAAVLSFAGLVEARGGPGGAAVCMLIGLSILCVPYLYGQLGAGTVKMHAAYCAWVGLAALSPQSIYTTLLATGAVVVLLLFLLGWLSLRRPAAAGEFGDYEASPIEPVPFQLPASIIAILGTLLAGGMGLLT